VSLYRKVDKSKILKQIEKLEEKEKDTEYDR
jgi:hypothetical protein